ncbi:MAG: hypothetical protein JWN37_83 [Candidatus Nomurabacteria bacterium]|nr:hypothetical protein [Candidatus Nomurabacteria bacterium]
MKKVVYIIPGGGESHKRQKGYNKIAKMFEEKGITPIHVEIEWEDRKKSQNFSNYFDQFLKVFKKEKGTQIYILGFSFGAMIAYLTASKTKPKAFILCSLSPYFEEDMEKTIKVSWVKRWRKAFVDSYSFAKFVSKVKSETYLLVGDKEDKSVLIRSKEAKKKIKYSRLTIIKGVKHNIGQKEYQEAIKKLINKL